MRARLPWLAPSGDGSLAWQPATWYRRHWPSMRAFALPSFYDGRIRMNLRGRERDGIVEPSSYTAVCDELERVLGACVDPRTGQSVVETIERAPGDPRDLDSSASDLVVVWRGCALAFRRVQGQEVEVGGQLYSDAMGEGGTAGGTYIGMIYENTRNITQALGGTVPPLPTALADWATQWKVAANQP